VIRNDWVSPKAAGEQQHQQQWRARSKKQNTFIVLCEALFMSFPIRNYYSLSLPLSFSLFYIKLPSTHTHTHTSINRIEASIEWLVRFVYKLSSIFHHRRFMLTETNQL